MISLKKVISCLSDQWDSFYLYDENGIQERINLLRTSVNAFKIDTLKNEAPSELVTIVGNLCTATDVVAKDVLMPHLEYGDVVIFTNAGSYAVVLSPIQFSSQEPPKELFLLKNGTII